MFGLFKKQLCEITPQKLELLAALAVTESFAWSESFASSPRAAGEEMAARLFNEGLAFSSSIIQFRAQEHYKFRNSNDVVNTLNKIFLIYQGMASDLKLGKQLRLQKKLVLLETYSEDFLNLVILYATRDYGTMGMSDNELRDMASLAGYPTTMIKHAGVNLMAVMFQFRLFGICGVSSGASTAQTLAIVKLADQARGRMIERVDALLKTNV